MKIESAHGNDVCFERWDTPLMHNDQLWLLSELRVRGNIHLFFKLNSKGPDNIYVITISSRCPLRFTDETFAYNCIHKYLKRKVPSDDKDMQKCSTYKIWNTSFIEEIEENNALSGYALERDKNIFQYLIITEDEYIEFITLFPPKWNFHENVKIDELITEYVKNSKVN